MYCNPDDVLNDGTEVTDLAFENWAPNWDPGFQSWLIPETDPYMDSYMIFSLYSATGCTLEEYRGEDGEKGSSTGTTLSGKYTFNIDDEEHPTLSFTDTYSMHCLSFDDVCDNYTSEIKVIELTEYILQLATMRTNDEGSWWLVWNFIPEDLALGLIEVPSPIYYIGAYAFYGCTSLTSITIPDDVTSIWDYAFCGCTSLTSITLSEDLITISDYVFYGCTSLTSITLPEDLYIIGESAFGSCTSLTSITSLNETPPYIENSTFSGRYSLATLYAASTDYATADYWENFTNIVYDTSGNAISSVTASTSAIRAIGNTIVITTETAQTAQVYSLAGQLIIKRAVSAGETSISMSTGGMYVVALADGTKAKVLVK